MTPIVGAHGGAWGLPGSYLLPRAVRSVLDEQPVPPAVASFTSSLSDTQLLRTARMPEEWVLLPAVARRLVEFIRQENLLVLKAVPDGLPVTRPLPTTDTGAAAGADVLVRAAGAAEAGDRTDALRHLTLGDVLRAARNNAEAFLIAMTTLDQMTAVAVGEPGGELIGDNLDDACPDGTLAALAVEVLSPSESPPSSRPIPPAVADAIRSGGVDALPLLDDMQRACLRSLPVDLWSAFLDGLPVRVRNALLRTTGGPVGLQEYLATASEQDLNDVRSLGTTGRAQLRSHLKVLLADARPVDRRPSAPADPSIQVTPSPPEPVPILPPDADLIRGDDPRFGDLLQDALDLASAVTDLPAAAGNELLVKIHDRRAHLAAATIEEEGRALVAAAAGVPSGHPRAVAMEPRYGLRGTDPATMDDIARVLGVSRARIGQISQRIARNLPTGRVWAPLADQLTQMVESMLPCSMTELNDALQGAGLTNVTWTSEALVTAAGLGGRRLDLHEYEGFAARHNELPLVRAVWITAQRISRRNGAAAVDQVVSELVDPHAITEGLVRDLLAARAEVTWLTRDWFWTSHAPRRNRLVNTSERILVVHQPQDLARMAGGVGRNYAWRNSTGGAIREHELEVPPVEVLGAFYASHPSFVTDADGRIRLTRPVDPAILGPEKLTLVRILRDRMWPAMSRNDLMEACVAEGMHASTAQIFLTYGECIENVSPNVWGLRGVTVPDEVVAALQEDARARSRSFERDWREGTTSGGRPWFSQRISPTFLYSGVLISPWSRNLDESSRLIIIDGTDGEQAGTLRRTGTFLYGLTSLFRKNKPVVGDFLRVTLYRSDGYAVAELGQEELTDAPDDWA